jgi:hypothetical protein
VPRNDGEAVRAITILKALKTPHLIVSNQAWGASLEGEAIFSIPEGVKRIVTFEIPGPTFEKTFRDGGIEVVTIDHHSYKTAPGREKPISSLEQLAQLIGWPMSGVDVAVALNDRGFVPALRGAGLDATSVSNIRSYDQVMQNVSKELNENTVSEKDASRRIDELTAKNLADVAKARTLIPNIPKTGALNIIDRDYGIDASVIIQELAIQSPTGVVNTLEISSKKIGFTGSPKVANLLKTFDYTQFGYGSDAYQAYAVGNPPSLLMGFKPIIPPTGETDLIPKRVVDAVKKMILDNL